MPDSSTSNFATGQASQPLPGSDDELVIDMLSSYGEDTVYSFQGMRRKLGLHQEKLTRILKRLEDDNLVVKTDEGYVGMHLRHPKAPGITGYGEPVIRGHLPPATDPVGVVSRLKGRWFKNFRWLGYTSNDREQSLYWITEDGQAQVHVQLTPVEVLVWADKTSPGKDTSSIAVSAAYELFDRISHLLPGPAENS